MKKKILLSVSFLALFSLGFGFMYLFRQQQLTDVELKHYVGSCTQHEGHPEYTRSADGRGVMQVVCKTSGF